MIANARTVVAGIRPRNSSPLRNWGAIAALALGLALPGEAAAQAVARAGRALPGVDTLTMRSVSRYLSADELRGRATGSDGEHRAASYLANQCARMGLAPMSSNGYFQPVPLVEAAIVPESTTVRITGPGVDTTFTYHEDFIPDVGTGSTLRGFGGPLVYVGRAQDILFRRSDLPDLHGAVALLRGEFGGFGAAADTLFARGAVGVISVVDDARRYRLFRATRGPSRIYVDDPEVHSSFIPPLPTLLAGPRMTVTLYQPLTGVTHGSWNDAYLNGLAAGLPPPQTLEGWRADVRVAVARHALGAANVGCVLPGTGAEPGRVLLVTAHYDHLGVGAPDQRGDSIYNGFSDNAVGVAMALAVAESFARARSRGGPTLRHPLAVLFFTGEERGLLGSDYFATHPAWPLSQIVGVVNLDANAPPGPPTAWRVAGDDAGGLPQLVLDQAARQGWTATLAPAAPGSDYYPFSQRGVPAVFFVPSDGPYEGLSVTASDSLRGELWGRYHQPSDEWSDSFPFIGLKRYAEFTREVLLRMDGWHPAPHAAPERAPNQGVMTSRTGPGGN
jgi:hypothetical protein